jgi:hypothetical protein
VKLHTVSGDPTWELTAADLRNVRRLGRLARKLGVGDLIYSPEQTAEPVRHARPPDTRDVEHLDDEAFYGAHPPQKPSRPDPRRLDLLRVAMRARGYELEIAGPYYHRVVNR